MSSSSGSTPRTPDEIMSIGREQAMDGQLGRAEASFRAALDLTRGSGTGLESKACGNLGSLYGMSGRRFEAIFLYRRGVEIDRARGAGSTLLLHLSNIAAMLGELQVWDRLRGHLGELDRVIADLPEAERGAAFDLSLWPRAQLALQDRDLTVAGDLGRRLREACADRDDPTTRAVVLTLESDLLEAAGRGAEAGRALEDALAIEDLPALDRLMLECRRLEQLVSSGREDEALRGAEPVLRRMEEARVDVGAAELSVELAADLGKLLSAHPAHHEAARRAYDLAASIVFSRIAVLDACVASIPELVDLPAEDRTLILDLRATCRHSGEGLRASVADLLRGMRPGEIPILHEAADQAVIPLCAWCGRVRSAARQWLPVGHYIPDDDDVRVTHGICEPCAARVREEMPRVADEEAGRTEAW